MEPIIVAIVLAISTTASLVYASTSVSRSAERISAVACDEEERILCGKDDAIDYDSDRIAPVLANTDV